MDPDDTRHGTAAGWMAHWRDREDPCGPCDVGRRRAHKAQRIDAERGRPRTVDLGAQAHHIIATTPRDQLARATGLQVHKLSRLNTAGPSARVHRRTRDRIIAAGGRHYWTPVGIQRRLRALHAIGWSTAAIGAEAGMWTHPLRLLINREDPKFVRREYAEAIIGIYDRLCMNTTRQGVGATRARNEAKARGWHKPLEWDNIDDPNEDPATTELELQRWVKWWTSRGYVDVDEAVVDALLAGRTVPSSRPEREEAMRRWLAVGRSEKSLCEIHGWKDGRYTTRAREDGAA